MIGRRWLRTCQSCGHVQEDVAPCRSIGLSDEFTERKCKKCKSRSLDHGAYEREDDKDWEEKAETGE